MLYFNNLLRSTILDDVVDCLIPPVINGKPERNFLHQTDFFMELFKGLKIKNENNKNIK